MSLCSPPSSPDRADLKKAIAEEGYEEERELCGTVDAAIGAATHALQQLTKVTQVSATHFSATSIAPSLNIVKGSDLANEGHKRNLAHGSAADSELRAHLEKCRDLLRKVDSERRYLRSKHMRLQKEHESQRAELCALHRYSNETHDRLLGLASQSAEERQKRRQLEEEMDAMTGEIMLLRRTLRSLPPDMMGSFILRDEEANDMPLNLMQMLAPDRRFEEAFKDKMKSIAYKRRFHQARAMHQYSAERLEGLCMEQEDPFKLEVQLPYMPHSVLGLGDTPSQLPYTRRGSGAAAGMQQYPASAEEDDTAGHAFLTTGASMQPESVTLQQSALGFPFQLPFTTATPQDAHIRHLVYHSAFAEPLTQLRDHVLRLSYRLKVAQDNGLRTLYTTFLQAVRLLGTSPVAMRWRTLYERQMEKMQHAHRDLLYDVVRQVNAAAQKIPELERGGKATAHSGAASTALKRRDVGCSAQQSTTMEEYNSAQLKEKLKLLKVKSEEVAEAALKDKQEAVQQCTVARQGAMQALQSLRSLSQCLVLSLQARTPAGDFISDPFAQLHDPLTEELLDDPRLGTRLLEGTDRAMTYVRRLARDVGRRGSSASGNAEQFPAPLPPTCSIKTNGSPQEDHSQIGDLSDPSSPEAASPQASPRKKTPRRKSAPSMLNPLTPTTRNGSASRRPRRRSSSLKGSRQNNGALPLPSLTSSPTGLMKRECQQRRKENSMSTSTPRVSTGDYLPSPHKNSVVSIAADAVEPMTARAKLRVPSPAVVSFIKLGLTDGEGQR